MNRPMMNFLLFLACTVGVTYCVILFLKKFEPKVQTFRIHGTIAEIGNQEVRILLLSGKSKTIRNITNLENFTKSFTLFQREGVLIEIQWEELIYRHERREIFINWIFLKSCPRIPSGLDIPIPVKN